MVRGSSLTASASRMAGRARADAVAAVSTCAFQSSAVFGKSFQVGLIGAPMIFCICGLTVVGTGSRRAGTSRAVGMAVCAKACGVETPIATAAQAAKDLSIGMPRLLMTGTAMMRKNLTLPWPDLCDGGPVQLTALADNAPAD